MKTLREKFKIQRFRPWHNMKVGGSSPVLDYVGLWVNMQRTWSPPWFLILSFVLERCSVPECSWGVPAAPAWPPPLPARVRGFPGASGVSVGQHQVSLDLEFWHFRSITLSTLQPPNLENMPPSPQGMNSEQNCSQYFVICQREGWRAEREHPLVSASVCIFHRSFY